MSDFDTALAETRGALAGIDAGQIEAACAAIAGAGSIVLYGCGREGLMMRALAMRLHHLGLRVAMQGDMACPPVGKGDLFLCSAGPGELSTVTALMQVARGAGAGVLPMGSVYEAALFFLFEIMVLRLRDRLGQSAEAMRARHTNLE